MHPLRVGVFSYRLPVSGEKRGGVDQVAHDLAEGLARRGHDVTVWSYDARPAGASYRVESLPGRRFFDSWLGRRLTFGYAGNLIAALPSYAGTDALIAMGDSLLLPLRGKPVIRTMHGSALAEAMTATSPWRFASQLGVYVQELATGLLQPGCVAVSENTRRHNPFVRRVIPNGVDLSAFFDAPDKKTSRPSLLFVGAMEGRKRGRLLLEWFADVIRPRVPGALLTMVGEVGPGMEGVEYRVGISTAALAELYRSSWVYASPSEYEGFGLPYVEAMASGTPVVATPNPGSREVLDDGRFGRLADDESFAETVVELLGDAEARQRLTARGLERAQVYALERMVDAYERLLLDLTRSRLD